MATNMHQFDGNGTRQSSDETIRRFLLGDLGASDRSLFEQRLFSEDGLDGRVRLAEFDLADDYAFQRLSARERDLFEENFLLTSNRRQKVKVSEVLRDRFSSIDATVTPSRKNSLADSLRDLFGLGRPAWRIAFGVLVLVIVLGMVWLVVKEPRIVEQITNRIPRRRPPPSVPREASHSTNTFVPEHRATPSPMPLHDQRTSPVGLGVALTPAISAHARELRAINVPKGENDVVQLQLTLKAGRTGPYRAELMTTEGTFVLSADSLKPSDSPPRIGFEVPARLLKTGDYQVRLSRYDGASKENVATYYFRVR